MYEAHSETYFREQQKGLSWLHSLATQIPAKKCTSGQIYTLVFTVQLLQLSNRNYRGYHVTLKSGLVCT